tara:strand:+ start:150 stop:593 length:444 start_codon:yes stop_codon:yes gene_type:complete
MSEKAQLTEVIKDSVNGFIRNKGITADSVMKSLRNICEAIEVDDKLSVCIKNKTGNDKAILAVDSLISLLNEYKMSQTDLSEREKEIILFFTSPLGRSTLMAGTSLVIYTIPHVKQSWKEADLNKDGCICGNKECKTFWKKLCCFCC